MKRVGIAALAAMSLLGAGAQSAQAGPPELELGVCQSVSEMFETMYVYMEPLPEPVGSTVGAAYRRVCKVTG